MADLKNRCGNTTGSLIRVWGGNGWKRRLWTVARAAFVVAVVVQVVVLGLVHDGKNVEGGDDNGAG